MAPLTWRNVDAPDLSSAASIMSRANAGLVNAFKAGGDIGKGIYDDQVEIGSRDALNAAQQFTSSADWSNALQSGTAYGSVDPRFVNAETLAWGADRRASLLKEEQAIQAMEIQRQQAARAASAARSGGGGGGSSSGGGSSGGGGNRSSGSSRDADAFAVAQAEAARRVTVAQYGEGSPEAAAATKALADISIAAESRTGLLDAADGMAGAIKADQAATAAIGNSAVAAMSSGEGGFDPYAIPFQGGSPTAAIPGPAVSVSSSNAPVAAPTVPATPRVEFQISEPATEAVAPVSVERPSLSFGGDVPKSTPKATEGRPVSWGDYASKALAAEPFQSEVSSSGSKPSAKAFGFSPSIEATPQWGAYAADAAAFDRTAEDKALVAKTESERVEQNSPSVVKTAFDSSARIINQAVESNPIYGVYEKQRQYTSLMDEGGPAAITDSLATYLGMADKESLQNEVTLLARETGTDFATAASAIASSGGPNNTRSNTYFEDGYAPWNWSPVDAMWSESHYDPDVAKSLVQEYKANEAKPTGSAMKRNNLSEIRNELSGIQRGYAARMESEVRAQAIAAARPNDPAAQEAYAKAKAATLEADKASIAFRENLNDRLSSIGMTKGINVRPNVEDYITPQMREEVAAEAATNLKTFGVERPTFVGFRNGGFDPGNVSADSEFGMRQANQWLEPVLSGRAKDNERESFFDWVAASPAASKEIFGRIQEMEYTGQDVDLPDQVEKAYKEYSKSSVPNQAISDLTALGFDLSGDLKLAAAVMNDKEVQEKLRIWRENQGFWTLESTGKFNQQNAQSVIRAALAKNRPDEG